MLSTFHVLKHIMYNSYCFVGVIYLKNTITSHWEEKELSQPTDPVPFSIHESDKAQVRDSIVEAVIQAPIPIR